MYINSFFEGTDGLRLFYRGWIPQKPAALLILIHGAGEHSGRYENVAEFCKAHQIAVIAPDLRGFGQSKGPRGHVNHFRDYLKDLKKLIKLMHNQYETTPLFLFGHSLGGLIVIRYGQLYPHKANGFILSSPALGFRFELPPLMTKLMTLVSKVYPNFSVQPSKWAGMLRKVQHLRPYFPEPSLEMTNDPFYTFEYTPRWLTELLDNGIYALSDASKFQVPLLCLYDHKDPIVHPNAVQRFLDAITIQDKNHITFFKGHHRPWHADHCHDALDNLITWVNSRL